MNVITSPASVQQRMKVALISVCMLWVMSLGLRAQVTYSFNALADFEVSSAGEKSDYFYNEIHKDNTPWGVGISHLNLINHLQLDSSWSVHARLWMQRDKGRGKILYRDTSKQVSVPNIFSIPELNIQWLSPTRRLGITVGSFINPFGSFNEKQLSTQRNIIGLPLAYAYYTNISPLIGFVADMGDVNKIWIKNNPTDTLGQVQWGSTQLYYGGYTTGAMMSWNVKPGKVNWKLALVNGAPNANQEKLIPQFRNWGLISRLKIQPSYNWEQGFSVSHGTFMQEIQDTVFSGLLSNLRGYSQTMVGTDVKLGSGFFEFSGEVIGTIYRVPEFSFIDKTFTNEGAPIKLSSLSVYGDLKYELPFLQGSYVACRLDYMRFHDKWDNGVFRYSCAFGYHINRFLLGRIAISNQHVGTIKEWESKQYTIRFVLTAHY